MAGKEARSFIHYSTPLSSLDDVKNFLEAEMVNVGNEAGDGSERWVGGAV